MVDYSVVCYSVVRVYNYENSIKSVVVNIVVCNNVVSRTRVYPDASVYTIGNIVVCYCNRVSKSDNYVFGIAVYIVASNLIVRAGYKNAEIIIIINVVVYHLVVRDTDSIQVNTITIIVNVIASYQIIISRRSKSDSLTIVENVIVFYTVVRSCKVNAICRVVVDIVVCQCIEFCS